MKHGHGYPYLIRRESKMLYKRTYEETEPFPTLKPLESLHPVFKRTTYFESLWGHDRCSSTERVDAPSKSALLSSPTVTNAGSDKLQTHTHTITPGEPVLA